MYGDLRLFALGASGELGRGIGRHLGVPLDAHEERAFEDGEHKSRPLVTVRGADVYVVHSLYGDDEQTGSDKLCRLLFFIGALRDAGAGRITALVPYLCYARKDRKTKPRDPVTTRYIAALFEAVGTDRVVTMEVHNLAAYQNAFRCRSEHLEARGLFVQHFAPLLREREVVVVSPDAGGFKRAEAFRLALGRALGRPVGIAFMEKSRSGGVVSGEAVVGEVAGRTVLLYDDLVSTGTTLLRAAAACRALGAGPIHAAACHGLFIGGAEKLFGEGAPDHVVVCDSVPPFRLSGASLGDRLCVLESAPLFAETIRRLHDDGSLVDLLEF